MFDQSEESLATSLHFDGAEWQSRLARRLLFQKLMLQLLIVEDEEELARNIKLFLESFREEFQVTVAGTGEAAVEELSGGMFDLLVADFRLPGMNGLEVLRRALASNPGTRAIMMTAYPSEELRKKAIRSGAVRFVEKPLDMEDLRLLLWETIESGGEEKAGLTVKEFIELLELAGESQAYRFRFAKDEGLVVVDRGCLVHATTATLRGPSAFQRMASWIVTDVEEVPREVAEAWPKNIEIPVRQQAMDVGPQLGGGEAFRADHEGPVSEHVAADMVFHDGGEIPGSLGAATAVEGCEPGPDEPVGDSWHNMNKAYMEGGTFPLRGTLGEIGLPDLLCRLSHTPGAWRLKVETDGGKAIVFVADGAIVHAAMGSMAGEDVVCALVTLEAGEYELEAVSETPRQTLTREWSALFLRAFAERHATR